MEDGAYSRLEYHHPITRPTFREIPARQTAVNSRALPGSPQQPLRVSVFCKSGAGFHSARQGAAGRPGGARKRMTYTLAFWRVSNRQLSPLSTYSTPSKENTS